MRISIKIIIVLALMLIGLFFKFSRPKENKFLGKTLKNENPILVSNFIGNMIFFQAFTIAFYFLLSYKNPALYFLGACMSFAALLFHIRDVTGKPIDQIFKKINFSPDNLSMNIFMRISFSLMVVFFIAFVVMTILTKT